MTARILSCIALAAALALLSASSDASDLDLQQLTGRASLQSHLDQLGDDLHSSFESALRTYADEIQARPYDVVLWIERCRFIEDFTATYEYVDWIDEAEDRSQACADTVSKEFSGHPEVELFRLEHLYGVQQLESGRELVGMLRRGSWTTGQTARLYEMLAHTADRLGKKQAAEYANRALALDEQVNVRLIVASNLIANDRREQALKVLTSPLEEHDPADTPYLTRKMRMLADLGARDATLDLYAALKTRKNAYYNHGDAAYALNRIGAFDSARTEFQLAANNYSTADERERFQFEFNHGTGAQALAAYAAWRDLGWSEDPVAINRLALFFQHPSLPWRNRDLLGFLGMLGTVGGLALLAILPISFVHYRGLARRATRGEIHAVEGWQLRHAWWALFAFLAASFCAMYTIGPTSLLPQSAATWGLDASSSQMARMTFIESMLGIVFLLPLGRAAAVRQPTWWGTRWKILKSVLIGASIALALRLPLIALWAFSPRPWHFAQNDLVWQLLAALRDDFGIGAAVWVAALAAPVVEEFIFRGVLLKAFSNHIAFGWANVLQAALFAALHQNLAATPLLFAFGLIAGSMARRSGGLLAGIVMHALFNLVAALILL